MIIAADSGGSKTLLRVYDNLCLTEEIILEGFGSAVDSTEDIPVLAQRLSEFKYRYPIEAVAFNLGGRNKTQIERILQKVFPDIPIQVFRESEGNAALALASHFNAECVLLAGTGTISIGKHPETGEMIINGGWGYLLGDQGSGYHIGIKALQHTVEQMDDTDHPDLLARRILGREHGVSCNSEGAVICQTRDSIFHKLSPLDRSHVASYTKIVVSCCEEKDPYSIKLMNDAGKDMAELVGKSLRKLALTKANGVLVTGGLLHTKAYWQASFEASLKEQFDIASFHYIPDGIIRGTHMIAEALRSNQ